MKKFLSLFAALLFLGVTQMWGENLTKTEGFETKAPSTSYQSTVTVSEAESDCEIGWTIYYGTVSTNDKISGSNSAQMRYYSNKDDRGYVQSTTAVEGLSNVAFKARVSSLDMKLTVSYSADGSAWTALATNIAFEATGANGLQNLNYDIPSGGKYIKFEVAEGSTKPSANNIKLIIDDVVFTYAEQGGEEPVVEPTTKTIYLNGGGSSLWNQANPEFFVHSWGGAADGDVHMTLVEGDVYKADIPADNTDLLFLRLATGTTEIVWSGEAHWNQSANQTIPEGKDLFTMTSWDNGEWSVYTAQGGDDPEPVDPTPTEKDSIYFVNVAGWAAPRVHLWGGTAAGTEWPGVEMTKLDDQINNYDVYKYVADKGAYVKCIFSDNGENQTADLDWTSGKYFYNDAWYAQNEIPAPVEPEDKLPVVAIAGTMNEWSTEANIMANATDSLSASVTIALEAQKYELKVVSDGNWLSLNGEGETLYGIHREWNEVAHINGVNLRNFELTADVAGEYTFTWTYADSTLVVTFPEKPAEPVVGDGPIFEWTKGAGAAIEADNTDLNANDLGTMTVGKSVVARLFGTNAVENNAKGYKLGNNDVCVEIEGTRAFAAGDTVVITGVCGGSGERAFAVAPVSTIDAKADTVLTNYQENTSDVLEYKAVLKEQQAGDKIRIFRLAAKTMYLYSIKVLPYVENEEPIEPQPVEVDSTTLYFVNNLAWEAVNAYVWPAEGDAAYKAWPGEAMTKEAEQINGFDVYSYKFPASYVNIIFNNGNSGEDNQTADLVWDATKPYFFDGEWYASVEEVAPHCAQVTEGIWTVTETTPLDANSIYVHNNLMKMKPAYAAAWDGFYNPQQFGEYSFTYAMLIRSEAWPTEQIPAGAEYVEGNKNTTSLIVEAKEDIDITIFYRRQTGNQSENDSKDLKIFDHSAITTAIQGVFQIVELDGDYFSATKKLSLVKGHRYTITAKGTTPKIFAIAYGQPAEPAPAKFYVTGDSALIADAASAGTVAWAPNAIKSENDTLVLNLKAGVDYQLSLTVDGTWNTKKTYANLTQEDKSGLYDVDGENHNIGFKLAEAGDVKVVYFVKDEVVTFELIGNFYVDQTPVDPQEEVTVYFVNTPRWDGVNIYLWNNETFENNAAWPGLAMKKEETKVQGFDVYSYTFVNSKNFDKCIFNHIDQTADLELHAGQYYCVDTWYESIEAIPELDIDEPAPIDPTTAHFYIKHAGNNWTWVEMTYDAVMDAFTYQSVWAGNGANINTVGEDNGNAWYPAAMINVAEDVELRDTVLFAYNYNTKALSVTLVGKYVQKLANGYYIIGLNGWNVDDLSESDDLFYSTGIETGEFSLETTLTEGAVFKVVRVEGDVIINWYGIQTSEQNPDGNYIVDAAHAGEKTIYFRPEWNEDWGGHIYVAPNETTAISNTAADAEAVKVLHNGMLLIRKGDKTYNVMGQTVK